MANIDTFITVAGTSIDSIFGVSASSIDQINGVTLQLGIGRGCFGGGKTGSGVNTIDYITIATTGNATNFGDRSSTSAYGNAACSSATRGCFGGGDLINIIDYVTISSIGNAIDFGDLTASTYLFAACSSSTRGCFCGGITPI